MPGTNGNQMVCSRIVDGARRDVGESRFDRYFGCTRLELVSGSLRVAVPNEMYAKWLIGKFGDNLLQVARRETGDASLQLDWTVDPAMPESGKASKRSAIPEPHPIESRRAPRPEARSSEKPAPPQRYSLDDYVVGEGNRLAFVMLSRLADLNSAPPAKLLFLHGECGVGKTHLLSALASTVRAAASHPKVRYLTGEDFTNEYIAAVRGGRIEEFRASFRRLDLLCIDDVHFIAGKSGTQQEFLHTFDALDMNGSRVALASDAGPREIANLHERLVSRCLSGMVVEIRPPDPSMRRAIVERFARNRGLLLEPTAVEALVTGCPGSVRDLEGVVTRIAALAAMMPEACGPGGRITPQLIRRAMGQGSSETAIRRPVRVPVIADIVCRTLGVELEDIRRRKRHRRVVLARALVAYLARQMTTHSYPEIAAALGCGSHSTMIDGHERMRLMIERGESCDGDAPGSMMNAHDLCERIKRLVLNTSPPIHGM
ncbi:MAG: ATP-binding protein [Phycisphaerae bacterium]|nr:ATP-binding protein [Phycisphaerae bacterium]